MNHDQMDKRELLAWAKRQESPDESHGRVGSAVLALFARAEAAEARLDAVASGAEAERASFARQIQAAEAKLAEAERERDEARRELADHEQDEQIVSDREEREAAAVREGSNAIMREALGPLYHKLWGQELEALGRMLDSIRADLAAAESREKALREPGRALVEALDLCRMRFGRMPIFEPQLEVFRAALAAGKDPW